MVAAIVVIYLAPWLGEDIHGGVSTQNPFFFSKKKDGILDHLEIHACVTCTSIK